MPAANLPIKFRGKGLTSRQEIDVVIEQASAGSGISFILDGVEIPALSSYVVNTLRNVVLGKDGKRLCIVEHFLSAAAMYGLTDVKVTVSGPEMPLGDGSCEVWISLFEKEGLKRKVPQSTIELPEPIIIKKGDRALMALPDDAFSITYLMDWKHPKIGKRWQSWSADQPISEIAFSRTFGWLKDHQALGLTEDVVSLTDDGFTHELRHEDEMVRHKLLDLLGDLMLSGVNPIAFKARFVSIKAGHEMDVQMARKLETLAKAP